MEVVADRRIRRGQRGDEKFVEFLQRVGQGTDAWRLRAQLDAILSDVVLEQTRLFDLLLHGKEFLLILNLSLNMNDRLRAKMDRVHVPRAHQWMIEHVLEQNVQMIGIGNCLVVIGEPESIVSQLLQLLEQNGLRRVNTLVVVEKHVRERLREVCWLDVRLTLLSSGKLIVESAVQRVELFESATNDARRSAGGNRSAIHHSLVSGRCCTGIIIIIDVDCFVTRLRAMQLDFGCTQLDELPCEFLPYVVRSFGEPTSFELQRRQRMIQQPLVTHESIEILAHVNAEVQLVDPRRVQLIEEPEMIGDGTRLGYRW